MAKKIRVFVSEYAFGFNSHLVSQPLRQLGLNFVQPQSVDGPISIYQRNLQTSADRSPGRHSDDTMECHTINLYPWL